MCIRDSAHTDRFRAYVRHEVVPQAKAWNPRMPESLVRTMNLIAEEDDMLDAMAGQAIAAHVAPVGQAAQAAEGTTAEGAVEEGVAAAAVTGAEASGAEGALREGAAGEAAVAAAGVPADGAAAHASSAASPGAPSDDAAYAEGFLLAPSFGAVPRPLQRRAAHRLLKAMLGADERIDAASVEAVLGGFSPEGAPAGGYVANIQGDLAVSANKAGVRVEPMAAFRARRKRARM